MFSTILVAVPAFRRVEPAMISGPTDGAVIRSTKFLSSEPGQQVTKMILAPALRPRARPRADEDHPATLAQRLGDDFDAVRDLLPLPVDGRDDFLILVDHHIEDVANRRLVDGEAGGIDLLGGKRLPLGLGRHLTPLV